MKKLLIFVVISIIFLVGCTPTIVTGKKTEIRSTCVNSHEEFRNYIYYGGNPVISVLPSARAIPIAQYDDICDAYEDKLFYMIELSGNKWYTVEEEHYNRLRVGEPFSY